MEFNGLVKTSLVDYPGHLAATLFTGGCNMRCPFCHNRQLVLLETGLEHFTEEWVLEFLKKKSNLLEAVCITGGEPTLQADLLVFLKKLRQLRYKIKLDTNGLNPEILACAIDEHLVDYVAMDIKNCTDQYEQTSGVNSLPISAIRKSIALLIKSDISVEFRTTVVREFHTPDDLMRMAYELSGAKKFVLQKYVMSPNQLSSLVFTPYTNSEMMQFQKSLEPLFEIVELRGL